MTSGRSHSFHRWLALAFGILAWYAASSLWQLQGRLGPHAQRINVRFADTVSTDARQALEQQFTLTAGEPQGLRTWTYLLQDQSAGNIGALLRSPQVEDTYHIDRQRLRVVLDQPGLPPWARELLEREWLPYISWALTAAGVLLVWFARACLWATLRWIGRSLKDTVGMLDRAQTMPVRREVLIGIVLCALFLAPLLLWGPTDDEEGALGFFSGLVYYRDLLLHGRWSYWFSDLGFGTPMPLGHRLDFHPVFGIGALFSLRAALSGLWIAQVFLMAVYFRRLLTASGLDSGTRLFFLCFYLFSAVSCLLFYGTDWVSCVVPWTLYPVAVYYLRDAFMGGAAARWWLTTVRLGVIFSLWVLNSHPGYLVPLVIVLAVYVLVAAPRTLAVYASLATAGLFALAASAERIYFLLHEKTFFPTTSLRAAQPGYSLLGYVASQLPPLTSIGDMRQPFAGAFVLTAALAAPFWWRRVDRHLRGCIVAFLAAVALSVTPLNLLDWTGLSGAWLFRDPMVFFALLSAAAVAQSALRAGRVNVRTLVLVLLAVQGLQQTVVAWHAFSGFWGDHWRLEFYRYQGHPTGVGREVVRAANRYGRRLYLSSTAQDYNRGYLSHSGIHVVTDYALLGLNPVNGWFKNVSMDRIYPSPVLMHGAIRGPREVIENATLLDVLGIDLVMTTTEENLRPEGLIRIKQMRVSDALGVDIFANPDAWPEAVLLSPEARQAPLPAVEGCSDKGALCLDYSALVPMRLPQDVALTHLGDGYQVRVPPSNATRLLFLSAFYRPEWVVTAGDQVLTIEPIADAFISVAVPPGVQDIQLMFRPRTRVMLTWLSVLSLATMLAALGTLLWRRRRGGVAT